MNNYFLKTKRAQDNNGERAMPPRRPPRWWERAGRRRAPCHERGRRGAHSTWEKLLLLTAAALWSILRSKPSLCPGIARASGGWHDGGGGVFACVGACGAALVIDSTGGSYCKASGGGWTTGDSVCGADSTVPHGQGRRHDNIGSFGVSKVTSRTYVSQCAGIQSTAFRVGCQGRKHGSHIWCEGIQSTAFRVECRQGREHGTHIS